MLSALFEKLENPEATLSPKEMRALLPFATNIMQNRPELVHEFIQLVPEEDREEQFAAWAEHMPWKARVRWSGSDGQTETFELPVAHVSEIITEFDKAAQNLGGEVAAESMGKKQRDQYLQAFGMMAPQALGDVLLAIRSLDEDGARAKAFLAENSAGVFSGMFREKQGEEFRELVNEVIALTDVKTVGVMLASRISPQNEAALLEPTLADLNDELLADELRDIIQTQHRQDIIGLAGIPLGRTESYQLGGIYKRLASQNEQIPTVEGDGAAPIRQAIPETGNLNQDWLGAVITMAEGYGGENLAKQVVEAMLEANRDTPEIEKDLINVLALNGRDELLKAAVPAMSPRGQTVAEMVLPLPKHERWQEVGEGPARWEAVFNKPAPAESVQEESPYKFSGKVYDRLLPTIHKICSFEDTGMDEPLTYRLAVLFSNPQEAERYVTNIMMNSDADEQQPVHDALLFEIPKQGRWDPVKWKDFMLKYGPDGSKFVGMAPRIERFLDEEGLPFPKSPREMEDVAANVVYERGKEHPEFAALSLKFGLSETAFNEGLDLIAQNNKTSDNLPDVFVDGADIGHPNYYMEKMAPGDPTGLLLGELTNCCQHLGDAGRNCAIHGFMSEDGGFYVWKHKTNGEITDKDLIIAQSWAWRGQDQLGNDVVVFDSFERLSKEYNHLMQPFMEQFAHDAKDHVFPGASGGIGRELASVRMGMGGNTPAFEGNNHDLANEALPVDYQGYRDSARQTVVQPRDLRQQTSRWTDREAARDIERVADQEEGRSF